MTDIKRCPCGPDCQAETCFRPGCNLIGWLGVDGELYNVPRAPEVVDGRTVTVLK